MNSSRSFCRHIVHVSILSFLLFCGPGITVPALGQKQANVWYFCKYTGLDFNTTPPTVLTGSLNTIEGCASIADRNRGQLLFYTNGVTVWNREHDTMSNGDGLLGHISSTQSALIVPDPADSLRYYIFTSDASPDVASPRMAGVNYSKVDMRLSNGLGRVIVKNVPLFRPAVEKLVGVLDCGGGGYWVIAHGWEDDQFYAYHITEKGVSAPVVSSAGAIQGRDVPESDRGYLKASPNGKKLAAAIYGGNLLQLFDFDKNTGIVSNPLSLSENLPYALSFSPDNSKLYLIANFSTLVQYDLSRKTSAEVLASRTEVFKAEPGKPYIGALQIGPDGRIYTIYSDFLFAIEHPNEPGGNCGVVEHILKLSRGLGLPNMIDGWFDETHDHCRPPRARIALTDTTVCLGSCLSISDLSIDEPIRWRWSFQGATPDTSTSRSPVDICYNDTGTFTVQLIAENANGADTAWGYVHVQPPVAIDAGNDAVLCIGDTIAIGTTIGTEDARAVEWTPVDGLTCPLCAVTSASPQSTTTYSLHVISDQGCESVDSVTVRVVPRPVAAVDPPESLCPGDSTQLHALGGTIYRWQPEPTLSCLECADPWVRPLVTTTYRVAVSTGGGCIDTAEVTIVVREGPHVTVSPDTTICAGTTAQLRASGATSYRWSPEAGLSCLDCPDPIARPSVTTIYRVESRDAGECIGSAEVTVQVVNPPEVTIAGDTTICSGSIAMLSATGGSGYRWNPVEGVECPTCSTTLVRPARTTEYEVVVSNNAGCLSRASMVVSVDTTTMAVTGDMTICSGESTTLRASGGESGYLWSPSDGLSCPTCETTEAHPSETTEYTVTAINGLGCQRSARAVVTVDQSPSEVYVSIPRNLHVYPGASIRVPVLLDTDLESAKIDSFEMSVKYEPSILRLREAVVESTLVEGWSVEVVEQGSGVYRARFVAVAGAHLGGKGELLGFVFDSFIGRVLGSEIELTVLLPDGGCSEVIGQPGRIDLDSICGLGFRLIEATSESYVLDQNHPNPFNPTTEIEFGLGLPGPTKVEVLDVMGRVVERLVEGDLDAGRYRVVWDASGYPSGVYYCRLRSGGWEHTNTMLLVK